MRGGGGGGQENQYETPSSKIVELEEKIYESAFTIKRKKVTSDLKRGA